MSFGHDMQFGAGKIDTERKKKTTTVHSGYSHDGLETSWSALLYRCGITSCSAWVHMCYYIGGGYPNRGKYLECRAPLHQRVRRLDGCAVTTCRRLVPIRTRLLISPTLPTPPVSFLSCFFFFSSSTLAPVASYVIFFGGGGVCLLDCTAV